jgi:hypothetical protein
VTTPTISRTLAALAATAVLAAAGCGGSNPSGDAAGSSPATPTSTGIPPLSDQQAPPKRLVIDVALKAGEVTPVNAQVQTTVGSPIIIRVDSDAADQLHVNSTPEHTFTVEPRAGQSFQFTVDAPGKIDVVLHELKRTVATIQVQ